MKANDYQVGGGHYHQGGVYQHWDLCVNLPLSYLEGNTTKYVVRWRNKGQGIADLTKALHYLSKLEENPEVPPRKMAHALIVEEVRKFNDANNLGDLERAYVLAICIWANVQDLQVAREYLFLLLDEAEALDKSVRPVPLKEENHHAERAGISGKISRSGV